MNIYKLFILIIISTITSSCAITQPRPEGKGWDKCPTCNGLGKKLIANSKMDGRSGSKKLRDSEVKPDPDLSLMIVEGISEEFSKQKNTFEHYLEYHRH